MTRPGLAFVRSVRTGLRPLVMDGSSPRVGVAAPTWTPQAMLVAFLALLAACLYAAHPPAVPDLAAQVARADAAKSGAFLGWNGWFGGLQLPAYSALSPLVMAWTGVGLAAAIAAFAVTGVGFTLLKDVRRPVASVVALTVAAFADILAGRVTFALGAAAAVGALALIARRWAIGAAVLGLLTFLLAPLAGLFLGVGALAVIVTDTTRRRAAMGVAAALIVAGIVQTVIFPGAGVMPYPWWHMLIAAATISVVGAVCPNRTVRAACGIAGFATVMFFFIPSPVGTNIVRLTWLAAAPTVMAASSLRKRYLAVLLVLLSLWPAVDLGIQLNRATSPASKAAFFAPLESAWRSQAALVGPAAAGERVELVDPASQWGSAYVAPVVPIARGWDRPTDRADNPLFYNNTLTAASYHRWLDSSSVGWVALPLHVGLDYASVREAQIIQQSPRYLQQVWGDSSWELFRVVGAQPVIQGAQLVKSTNDGVTFRSATAGTVHATIRWSPYLRLTSGGHLVDACIVAQQAWTRITVSAPGTYTLAARIDPNPGPHTQTCGSG